MEITDIITIEKAKELIHVLIPRYKGMLIEIDHIGEFDKKGCKHTGAICVIQFNENQQITIWDKGIQHFDSGRSINDQVIGCGPNTFSTYRLLKSWGVVS